MTGRIARTGAVWELRDAVNAGRYGMKDYLSWLGNQDESLHRHAALPRLAGLHVAQAPRVRAHGHLVDRRRRHPALRFALRRGALQARQTFIAGWQQTSSRRRCAPSNDAANDTCN